MINWQKNALLKDWLPMKNEDLLKENSRLLEENEKLKKRLKPIELDELSHYLVQDRLYFVMKSFHDFSSNNAILNSSPELIELTRDITYKFRDLAAALSIAQNKKDVQES